MENPMQGGEGGEEAPAHERELPVGGFPEVLADAFGASGEDGEYPEEMQPFGRLPGLAFYGLDFEFWHKSIPNAWHKRRTSPRVCWTLKVFPIAEKIHTSFWRQSDQ